MKNKKKIINIYGKSGSGKTYFIKKLLKENKCIEWFFNSFSVTPEKKIQISLSIYPLPKIKASVEEYFINILGFNRSKVIKFITNQINFSENFFYDDNPDKFFYKNMNEFSAGEQRRIFLIAALFSSAKLKIIDEPFANTDSFLHTKILEDIVLNSENLILLTHKPLKINFHNKDIDLISINTKQFKKFK